MLNAEHGWARRIGTLYVVLVALLALLGASSPPSISPLVDVSPIPGFSPGGGILYEDPAQLQRDMNRMAAVDSGLVRLDIDWSRIEARESHFEWAATDRAIASARRAGLAVIGLVAYTPSWARPPSTTDKSPPEDPEAFARFAALAARRYGDDVRVWEIWNEPNIATFWRPAPDPARYAALLTTTARLLRAVQPQATILTGGLSGVPDEPTHVAPTTFVDALYRAGAGSSFDGVSVHPYPQPAGSAAALANQFERLTALHQTLMHHGGDAVEVWITEIGAPTSAGASGATPAQQAMLVRDAFAMTRTRPWIRSLLLFSYRDAGTRPNDIQQNFGLRYHDDTPKPAWSVLRETASSH